MSVNPNAFRRLVREIRQLQTEPPEGIRISTDDEDILDVTGIIQGPAGTPYEGGYFRVRFKFTEEFPAAPPKCWFMTKIFHPNVSKAGEICVNTLKKDWKREYGIAHILVTIKCLLIYPNPESALDEAAGKMLLEKYEDYCKHAKLMTSVHATPKTRPPEFDVPSVIPDSKPAAAAPATAPAAASTEQPTAPTTTTTTTTKLAPPTTNASTRSVSPGATTRHNTPGATPLVSLNNLEPAPADATAPPATTKPPSKTNTTNSNAVEPLQAATTKNNNSGNDQNVDPKLNGADALAVKAKTTTTASSNAVPSKRSGTGATGGAEKRKKGLKRL